MPTWSSNQYLKFKKERTQPAIDLAMHLNGCKADRIIDLGCGPGNSTAILRKMFPAAEIVGIDSSDDMIAAAKKSDSTIHFQCGDVSKGLSGELGTFDIVFSNACIQWIPDHESLLPKIMNLVKPGGRMAIQLPVNYDEPIHRIINEVVGRDTWKEKIPARRLFKWLTTSEYYDVLASISSDFSIWETTYLHRMASHEAIIEWYKGTGLRPYLDILNEEEGQQFIQDVSEEVKKQYPKQRNGEVIFPFPRLFFIADK